jgi:hypothetical protein
MSFVKPGPLVGYVTGDVIDEADINYWCAALPDCIDGAGGGSYTLSAPLSITGDDVTVSDLFATTLTTTSDLFVGDDLDVGDNAAIVGTLSVGELATLGSLSVTNNATVQGDLAVDGVVNFNDSLDVDFGVSCASLTAETGNFVTSLQWLFKMAVGPNADTSFTSSDAAQVIYTSSMSTNRTYTLSGSYDAGQWFIFSHRATGGYTINITPGTGLVFGEAVLMIYTGANWLVHKLA